MPNQTPKPTPEILSYFSASVAPYLGGTSCIPKGKENKKNEYDSKASVAVTADTGIIVSVVAHPENIYDGHTLPEVLELAEAVMGERPKKAIVDRGYQGEKHIDGTDILSPENGKAEQTFVI